MMVNSRLQLPIMTSLLRTGLYLLGLLLAISHASIAIAGSGVCTALGLEGSARGACTAYCEAMRCDQDSPASDQACQRLGQKLLEGATAQGVHVAEVDGVVRRIEVQSNGWRVLAITLWTDIVGEGFRPLLRSSWAEESRQANPAPRDDRAPPMQDARWMWMTNNRSPVWNRVVYAGR